MVKRNIYEASSCFFGPALMLFAPVAQFLAVNQYPLLSAEAGILFLPCAALGFLLGCTARFGGKTLAAVIFGSTLAFSIDIMYDMGALKILLVLFNAFALLLRKHIAVILTTTFATLLAVTILFPPSNSIQTSRNTFQNRESSTPPKRNFPNVLHLILDGHIGLSGIPKELTESTELVRSLTSFYVENGFRLHSHAYSEYRRTRNSIPNMVNFTSSDQDMLHLEAAGETGVLTENQYFQRLSELGYRFHIYQTSILDLCQTPGIRYVSCHTYETNTIRYLQETRLETVERTKFIIYSLIETSSRLKKVRESYLRVRDALAGSSLPDWKQGTYQTGPIPVFSLLPNLEQDLIGASRGSVFFAHLLIPHSPFVVDSSCEIYPEIASWLRSQPEDPVNTDPGRAESYRRYFAQIECQQTLLKHLFEVIKGLEAWEDATVIVHGDHGARIRYNMEIRKSAEALTEDDFHDAFSTLYAVRTPGSKGDIVDRPLPLFSVC